MCAREISVVKLHVISTWCSKVMVNCENRWCLVRCAGRDGKKGQIRQVGPLAHSKKYRLG